MRHDHDHDHDCGCRGYQSHDDVRVRKTSGGGVIRG